MIQPATPLFDQIQDAAAFVRSKWSTAPAVGITLTDSFAMMPPASVSGLYLSHPQAKYFNIGRVGRDQLEDYARRKGMTVEDASRWLTPIL